MVGPPMMPGRMHAGRVQASHRRVELVHRVLLHHAGVGYTELLIAIHHVREVHVVLDALVVRLESQVVHALHRLLVDVVSHLANAVVVPGRARHACGRRSSIEAAEVLLLDLCRVAHHVASQSVHVAVGANLTLQPGGEAATHLVTESLLALVERARHLILNHGLHVIDLANRITVLVSGRCRRRFLGGVPERPRHPDELCVEATAARVRCLTRLVHAVVHARRWS